MARETLEDALAVEEERAVRDHWREGRWNRLAEVDLVIDHEPGAGWQDRVLAEVARAPARPRSRWADARRAVAGLLIVGIVVGASLALARCAAGGQLARPTRDPLRRGAP